MRAGLPWVCGCLALLAVFASASAQSGEGAYAGLPGGSFRSALRYEDQSVLDVAPFALERRPVTNAEFLGFVRAHPEWQRDRVRAVFADDRYLSHWSGATDLGATALPQQPVTRVSWFAARAYCASRGARLPTWTEWEYAAAADAKRADARKDPEWRARILGWYSRPSTRPLDNVGTQPANVYGIHDLHGLVWEWTDDFSSLLVDGDNRNQGDADRAKFCGAGALAMEDPDNYAVLMRVAMLSALDAEDTTNNLGFRCAATAP